MVIDMISFVVTGEVGTACYESVAWGWEVSGRLQSGEPEKMRGVSQRDRFGEKLPRQRELLVHSCRAEGRE